MTPAAGDGPGDPHWHGPGAYGILGPMSLGRRTRAAARVRRRLVLASLLLACLPASRSGAADALEPDPLYEWVAIAPVVVTGESLGDNGKFHEFRLQQVLRGEAAGRRRGGDQRPPGQS